MFLLNGGEDWQPGRQVIFDGPSIRVFFITGRPAQLRRGADSFITMIYERLILRRRMKTCLKKNPACVFFVAA